MKPDSTTIHRTSPLCNHLQSIETVKCLPSGVASNFSNGRVDLKQSAVGCLVAQCAARGQKQTESRGIKDGNKLQSILRPQGGTRVKNGNFSFVEKPCSIALGNLSSY